MTEFAFSGVGINPHYGTPGNPCDRRCIPGGSSSGAAVSVADGGAVVAIGTDTGGSVRIPAALCGIVGLKPTQKRISRAGTTPLSATLDSIGPLANSVACCAIADAVMAGEEPIVAAAGPGRGIAPGRAAEFRPRRSRTGGGNGVRRRLHNVVARRVRGSSICRLPSLASTGRSTSRAVSPRSRPLPGIGRCWPDAATSTIRGSGRASSAVAA